MKTLKTGSRWIRRHIVSVIAGLIAAGCWWEAYAIVGSPEASVILGLIGVVFLVIVSADVQVEK